MFPISMKVETAEDSQVEGAEGILWRRRADSNRCIKVLQTSPLATWVRRQPLILFETTAAIKFHAEIAETAVISVAGTRPRRPRKRRLPCSRPNGGRGTPGPA